MDDPMTMIIRANERKIEMPLPVFLETLSELSAIIGGFTCATNAPSEGVILTWACEEDGVLHAQLSQRGLYLEDSTLDKRTIYQIAGFCYLNGIPLYLENDLEELIRETVSDSSALTTPNQE